MKKCNIKGLCERAKDKLSKLKAHTSNTIKKAKEWKRKHKQVSPKTKAKVLAIAIIAMVIVVAAVGYRNVDKAPGLNVVLLAGLVAVTTVYAYSTIQMANEMKVQRYDAVRPVIDIQRNINVTDDVIDLERQTLEANAALSKDTSHGLSCILHNIGLGPAIDVFSFIEHPSRPHLRLDFGTIATEGKTERKYLSLKHKGNRMALVVYYKDIYGHVFESSREVSIEKKPNPNWEIDPLQIRPVKEDELP